MSDDYRWEWIRFHRLRSSGCTHVHVEKAARVVYRSWLRVRQARKSLQRAKENWYEAAPRPVDRSRPFCFVLRRMKRTWREADRANDLAGFPAHRTVGATEIRRNWSAILCGVMASDEVIRIRHQLRDEPAILITESRFRALERAAPEAVVRTVPGPAATASPGSSRPQPAHGESAGAFLTGILGPRYSDS